jgi:hypothetical protein
MMVDMGKSHLVTSFAFGRHIGCAGSVIPHQDNRQTGFDSSGSSESRTFLFYPGSLSIRDFFSSQYNHPDLHNLISRIFNKV